MKSSNDVINEIKEWLEQEIDESFKKLFYDTSYSLSYYDRMTAYQNCLDKINELEEKIKL